ncbi:HepT-like ribonuclease domain-containing protein [Kocuria sp.]|uniref:HepT-like ribonuclease domain-containing protein n=1 Tax=Kocuria sp. TaxID=1871328 RepID=UPI0026DEAC15|nr:HepT-like ribonuclease domain-containing protein [Kocuria sp.]MDO5617883.1 DUF86 domain-containing protein [Kocuria sp.]
MSRTARELIIEAQAHLDKIVLYAQEDVEQDVVIDAIALRLAAAIDSLSRIPPHQLQELFGPDWQAMKAVRNRIAHGYLTVSPGVLRATLDTEIPDLRQKLATWLRVNG